jgi:hypothetical protein
MDRSDQLLQQIQPHTWHKVLMCRHRHLCSLDHTECTKGRCLLHCTHHDYTTNALSVPKAITSIGES